MLTLVTSSQATRDKLPRIGYIHALDIWVIFCVCLILLSLLEFAIVFCLMRYHSTVNTKQKIKRKVFKRRKKKKKDRKHHYNICFIQQNHSQQVSMNRQINLNKLKDHLVSNFKCLVKNSTSHTSSSPYSSNKKTKKKSNNFCSLLWFKSNNNNNNYNYYYYYYYYYRYKHLADNIDRKCRFIFPICFLMFNIFYWWSYTQLDQDIATKHNVYNEPTV